MVKHLLSLLALFISLIGFTQATLHTENFEALSPPWTAADDLLPNSWIIESCAGNGPSMAGSDAMYITKGGVGVGCGATGDIQYAYANAPTGTLMATEHSTIDATCASNIQVTFDYKIDGIVAEDFGEVVYSTDGGTSWFSASGELPMSATWTTTTIGLPSAVDASVFELGFRFTYNDATLGLVSFAVDNIIVTGTDTVDPTITCPAAIVDLTVSVSCQAICGDYTNSMVTLADNCTDSINIIVTQDIPEFTIFGSSPGGSEIITLTATDESGNQAQCVLSLNIVDTQVPTVTCPPDTNIYVDTNCDGIIEDYLGDVIVTDNCTTAGNFVITQSPLSGTIINGSIVDTPVTITATDESGNPNSCIFIARTIDTLVATIICPTDTNVYADNSCDGLLLDYTGDAVASDNCIPFSSLTITQSPLPSTTITADQVITLTVSGAIPNIDQQCSFNALFVDTISPTVTCPVPTTLYVDGSCQVLLPDYSGSVAITENCSVLSITQSPIATTVISSATDTDITMTVTDASGNSNQCIFTQPIVDTISPTITCPSDQDEFADINCFALLGDYTSLVVTGDNCSSVMSITQTDLPGTSIATTTAVTLMVTDDSGNNASCQFNVNIVDNLAPTVTCPSNVTVGTNTGCDYSLSDFTVTATGADNCTAAISIAYTQSPVAGTLLGIGVHTITVNAFDATGNTSSCTFDITVEDQTIPTITCPSNQNVIVDASCQGLLVDYTGMATPADNCTSIGNLIVTQVPSSGTTISGTTLITLTVTDENSNTANCVFNAVHTDTISPTVTCPGDQLVTIDGSCQYPTPDLSSLVTGTDNCSVLGNMTITQNPPAASTQSGLTSVVVTLTDEQGNQASCITNLLPNDISAPTITCPANQTNNLGLACDYVLPNYASISSVLDNCSNYTIDQTPPAGTVVNPGSNTITLTVTDAGGNTDQCIFDLTITENGAPTITCPADISTCDPNVTYSDPTFNDNCLAAMSQTDLTGFSSGMVFPIGITTLEYTVADSSGNSQSCTFDVEILDFPSPANITLDTLWLCNQNTTLIDADPITSGTGGWSVFSGQGTFNNATQNSTGVNNVGYGENIYVWSVTSVACGNDYDTLVVVNSQEDLPASTQDTIYACTDATVILQSNVPLFGIGSWSTNQGGVIDDVSSSNTTSTLVNAGWNEFIWTISSGSCPANADTLMVYVSTDANITTSDTSVCLENNSLYIVASIPSSENYFDWTVLSGGADLVLDDISPPNATVTDFALGINLFVYEVGHPVCPSVYDTLEVVTSLCNGFDPYIPTVMTPNFDGKNDLFHIDFLEKVYPDCHVVIFNRWGSVVYESTGYEDPWDGTFKGEPLPMGTYFYKIELNDPEGTTYNGDISIIH
ncbi:MAG: HYR domain-containing protein [Crocinitomicaceae bacterium]|nr:HYR domain-containing protein [Crocinitomicaceae bacterium]